MSVSTSFISLKEFDTTAKLFPDEILAFADAAERGETLGRISEDTYIQIYTEGGSVRLDIWFRLNPYWDSDNYVTIKLTAEEARALAYEYEKNCTSETYECLLGYREDGKWGGPPKEGIRTTK